MEATSKTKKSRIFHNPSPYRETLTQGIGDDQTSLTEITVATWASALLQFHEDGWLMHLRAKFAPSSPSSARAFTILAGRAETSRGAGRLAECWATGVRQARYELQLREDEIKEKSREKAAKRLPQSTEKHASVISALSA